MAANMDGTRRCQAARHPAEPYMTFSHKLPPDLEALVSGIGQKPDGSIGETADPTKLRFKLVDFDELKWTGTSEYLVKGVLPRTGMALVWGPPKCGKSFWALTVMMHIAMGREYRGRRVNKQEVVYLALEGQDNFGKRAEAFRQRYLAPDEKVPDFKLCGVPIDLIADHKQLIKDIRDQSAKPGCVVIDTLNRSLVGSESVDKDMAAYIRAATAIQEAFDCLV